MHNNKNLVIAILLFPANVWAIPSPDLVINMFGSAAQLLGLTAVLLGAGFVGKRHSKGAVLTRKWKGLLWLIVILLLVSLSANLLQYTYYSDQKTQRLQTNLWRSSSEAGRKVGDTSLKTLSFSEQISHPRGISTETLQQWLDEGLKLNIIDVRETEEYETGFIIGARHSRYPDTSKAAQSLLIPSSENILVCYSGNRSSELCSDFTSRGLPCRFVVGGYEKWIAENRSLNGKKTRERIGLRELPGYPNRNVLLDTAEAVELVVNEKAVFIDVRYPADFARQHLPDAVNLPLRKLTGHELELALQGIPRRPLIAACYDKRSCFYSEIIGLKLHRAGHDFRGRYTVPHEYSLPVKEKAYVESWQKMQSQTLLDYLIKPLQKMLLWLHVNTSSLAVAIIMLVLVMRLLVLPVSIKAERDNTIMRRLRGEIEKIKHNNAADRQRASQAIMQLYHRYGLTPVRNMLGSVIQMILFLAFFSAVNSISVGSSESFFWVNAIDKPDPLYILPILVGMLMFIQIQLGTARRSGLLFVIYMLLTVALGLLCVTLSAAVNFYLVVSLAFIVIQTMTVQFVESRKRKICNREKQEKVRMLQEKTAVVALSDAHRYTGAGNKAGRLGEMLAEGLPVPDGFIVTDSLLSRCQWLENGELLPEQYDSEALQQAYRQLGAKRVAVRSTGMAEDGSEQSFAGIFDSLLNVPEQELLAAISQVRRSYMNSRSATYSGQDQHSSGSVLVQAMIEAEYAGVLFTRHPANSGWTMVELVEGLGESLVSGSATPLEYCFGVVSGKPAGDMAQAPIELAPLLELGRKIELLFGRPQDIEWAYVHGQFYILQARDITTELTGTDDASSLMEQERQRILQALSNDAGCDTALLQQNELAELLPSATPLSLSIMENIWGINGTTEIACHELGIRYHVNETSSPYLVQVFGQLYINRQEGGRRFSSPGSVAAFRLSRLADEIEQNFRQVFVPQLSRDMRLREALDLRKFTSQELISLLEEWTAHFIEQDYVQAEIVNIAADFYLKTADVALRKRDLDPAVYLGHGPETVMHHVMGMLPGIRNGERQLKDFLDVFGCRAVHDYELAEPRYFESPELVEQMVNSAAQQRHSEIEPADLPAGRLLGMLLNRARRFQSLKEDAKHYCMREYASLRPVLLELDRRLELGGGIFYLRLDEILASNGVLDMQYKQTIKRRRTQAELFRNVSMPACVSIQQIEALRFTRKGELLSGFISKGRLSGKRVAGDREVLGVVRIMDESAPLESFRQNEILVARYTDPRWIAVFNKASAVVTEVGGWLSHMAIVAREYNMPCIVGASGILSQLKTGQQVRICENGDIDRRVSADRRSDRRDSSAKDMSESRRKADRRQQ